MSKWSRNTSSVNHEDLTEYALPVVESLPVTARLASVQPLESYCAWWNMLIKQPFMLVSAVINGHRHVLRGLAVQDDPYIRVQYLGYDGKLYVTCDIIDFLDIQGRFKR